MIVIKILLFILAIIMYGLLAKLFAFLSDLFSIGNSSEEDEVLGWVWPISVPLAIIGGIAYFAWSIPEYLSDVFKAIKRKING